MKNAAWFVFKQMKTNPRVALVIGGNRAIGLEGCRQLAQRGHKVLLGTRDPAKGEAAARKISGDLEVIVVDVAETDAGQPEIIQSSGRSPAGAIFTSLGSNWPSTVTRSLCAFITSRMFL